MIVGTGDIATVLKEVDRDDYIFFASGVSNSQEKRESEFEREKDLLMSYFRQYSDKHIVYFSSLCTFYAKTRYAKHKRQMEIIVREFFGNYTIIRLGNITWGSNPHTIINYFRNQLKEGKQIEVRDEYRYITTLDEFIHWIKMIPEWNCEMNLTGRRMKVPEILEEFCGYTQNPYANA